MTNDVWFCVFEDCDQQPHKPFLYCEAHARQEIPAELAAQDMLNALRDVVEAIDKNATVHEALAGTYIALQARHAVARAEGKA